MPIIPLEQGSREWKKWRNSKITATDTPIIMGVNPWKTKSKLWNQKLGFTPDDIVNDAMLEGQRKEPIARALLEEKLGIKFTPVVYQKDDDSWMAASLDGISECGKYLIEIKCPKKSKIHDENDLHHIPIYYKYQMYHQLICCPNAICNYFCTYFPENKEDPLKITRIDWDRNKEDDFAWEICDRGYEFYEQMINFEEPKEWLLKQRDK